MKKELNKLTSNITVLNNVNQDVIKGGMKRIKRKAKNPKDSGYTTCDIEGETMSR